MTTPRKKQNRIHASCVAINSQGVLLMGKSGSGKSDLALRLLARGASLVADDQVILSVHESGRAVVANVDASIRGLLEIRGIGLVRYPVATDIPVALVIELVTRDKMEHIPIPATYDALGFAIPKIAIDGFDASAPAKVYAALYALKKGNLHTGFLEVEGKTS